MGKPFDFERPASGAAKQRFHNAARRQLRALAVELVLPANSFDLRSNKGGNAVSGEVTLHGEHVYVQAGQCGLGLLYRSCKHRRDYTGGPNHWTPLDMLNRPVELAALISRNLGNVRW
jgi:hypothetical protein